MPIAPLPRGWKRGLAHVRDGIERWLDADRDQLALWAPVALGLGISAWFALPGAAAWRGWMLLCAGAGAACFALLPEATRMRRALVLGALLAACGCGLIWARAERVAASVLDRPRVVTVEGRIDAVEPLAARDIVRLRLALATPGLPSRVRINVPQRAVPPGLDTGATIRVRARLMPPAPPAIPGAYDFARVAWFQGLGASGRALDPPVVVARPTASTWPSLAAVRARLSRHIHAVLPGGEGGIAAALATGDQGGIGDADAEAIRRSGLAHLLSVSGLHVSAVVAAIFLLTLRLLALSPALALRAPLLPIAAGVAALGALGYTLLTGAEVPTVRAFVAALIVLAGMVLGRDAITLRLVAAGALIVLLLWPESLAGVSFQLSFAAVTAIVAVHEHPRLRALLARRDEAMPARLLRALAGLLITGVAVEAALAPIALFHFHRTGLYGAFANIVAIPLTTFVIMPVEAIALLADAFGFGAPFWWVAGRALALLLAIAHHVGGASGAVTMLPAMPWSAYALMVAGGLWLALWRTRVRRLGLVPLAIGALWAVLVPAPDLLVTGDGRHLALRGGDGRPLLLRPRAGDYVRGMLGEGAASEAEPGDLADLPGARCGPDLCAVELIRGGRRWRLLATRSPYLVDIGAMNRACARADIVLADRRLPRTCRPRWLKVDRPFLARTGGLAIGLARGRVTTVAEARRGKPWAAAVPPGSR